MKRKVFQFLAIVLSLAIVCAFAACKKDDPADPTTTDPAAITSSSDNASGEDVGTEPVTDDNGETEPVTDDKGETVTGGSNPAKPDDTTTTKAPAPNKKPETKAEILAVYKAAVDRVYAKQSTAPGYDKAEWQTLSTDAGWFVDMFSGIIAGYMTSEEEAKGKELQVTAKGSDKALSRFQECTLTNTSVIKSATCTQKGGNYVLKIVLNKVRNPTRKDDFGKITQAFLTRQEVLDEVNGIKVAGIKIVREIRTLDLDYSDCTISCEINPTNNQFVYLHHTTNCLATVDASVSAVTISGTATIIDYLQYTNFKY